MKKLDFSKFHVLVLGDVMLDKYIFGDTNRISPEAPVPIVEVDKYDARLGGAANVALNIISMGAQVSLIGVVGDDDAATEMSDLLVANKINDKTIKVAARPTTVKTRVISGAQHLLRIDRETKDPIDGDTLAKVLQSLKDVIANSNIDYVILQDYNKGVFTKEGIVEIIKVLKLSNVKYAVDPKFDNAEAFANADIFKPNLKEARRLVSMPNVEYKDLAVKIKSLMNCNTVVLTLSEDGLYCLDDNEGHLVPTESQDIVDVCGAGDTVISSLVLARLLDLDLREQAVIANVAAGVVCQKPGVVPVTVDEIARYLLTK